MAAGLLIGTQAHAQSWKDLFNKGNIEKVVNAVTGKTADVNMVGTWTYQGSAVEFESDNLLMKAGGAAASSVAEGKLNEQLTKLGIRPGQVSFTFNADSTFVSQVGSRKLNGTYSYDAATKQVNLKMAKIVNINAKMNYSASSMDLLFNSDKLLKLATLIGSKSSNSALQTVSSLASKYEGMMLGMQLKK
jgi:hypothetical protein